MNALDVIGILVTVCGLLALAVYCAICAMPQDDFEDQQSDEDSAEMAR